MRTLGDLYFALGDLRIICFDCCYLLVTIEFDNKQGLRL